MLLAMLLLTWNPYYLNYEGIKILRVDGRAIVFETNSKNISMGCEYFDEEMEFPYWDIEFATSQFLLVPRRAHLRWCEDLRSDFRNLIRNAKGGKLTVFGTYTDRNIPPELPGLSMYYHSIKNQAGDCMGHFSAACDEDLEYNWNWVGTSDWSEMNTKWY